MWQLEISIISRSILALGVNRPAVTADRMTEITPILLAIPNAVPENLNKRDQCSTGCLL